ncbi:MAG: 50S ribosomal protein L21 [Acidimicrobiaceae bacterium]|nr:50S ribosomal protein L21 [Acidimicrobiaceae bacterium]
MFAVISTGGKQERVEEGAVLEVELLGSTEGTEVHFSPILVVDGDRVVSKPAELTGASVTAVVVGEAKGPKVIGFKYKSKANQRKRWGHRQHYSVIRITSISA